MKYNTIPDIDVINKTADALRERGVEVFVVENGTLAFEKIKELIPLSVSVNNGASKTLEEIGFVDYLKSGEHGWNNLHAKILTETDKIKQAQLRKQTIFADYYLGSVHAITETGQMIIASASGSQLPSIIYTSPNIIFVAGVQKIVPNLDEGMTRLKEYVVPLEDKHMKEVGYGGTTLAKIVIFECEPAFMGRKVRMILIKESLGF